MKEKVAEEAPALALAPNRDVEEEDEEAEGENEKPVEPPEVRDPNTELSTFWPKLKVTPEGAGAGAGAEAGAELPLSLVKENKAGAVLMLVAAAVTLLLLEKDRVAVALPLAWSPFCTSTAASCLATVSAAAELLPYFFSMLARCRS